MEMNDTEYEEEQPDQSDQLRSVPTIVLLDEWIENSQMESMEKYEYGITDFYPNLMILSIQVEIHAKDFPDFLKSYMERNKYLDTKYGSAISKKYELYPEEARERLKNILTLARDIGPMMIDEKTAYNKTETPDYIDFSGFEEE